MGVCSYYQLKFNAKNGALIAQSAGDLRDAPWPDGATEFVDFHRDQGFAAGIRYAVMVVNNYAGMPFSQLDRAYAGLMLRDDPSGTQFDPRTVELKFALAGENGIFLPLVIDLQENVLHWLDVQSKGQLQMNNVQNSNKAIARICPELMTYFASGGRASMFDLGLLHAAGRCKRVFLRKAHTIAQFVRRNDESIIAFHARLVNGHPDEPNSQPPRTNATPMLGVLFRGDLNLPAGSAIYALFREKLTPSIAASDLLS